METIIGSSRQHTIQLQIRNLEVLLGQKRSTLAETLADLAEDSANADILASVETQEQSVAKTARDIDAGEIARRDTKESRAKRLKELRAKFSQLEDAGQRMEKLTSKIVAHIEAIGPLLAEWQAMAADRGNLAYSVYSEAQASSPNDPGHSRRWGAISNIAWARGGAMSMAISSALWRSGLGRIGPDLSPHLTVGSTDWDAPYPRDAKKLLSEGCAKERGKLGSGIWPGVAALEAIVKKEA
jgi:hypothetical protein